MPIILQIEVQLMDTRHMSEIRREVMKDHYLVSFLQHKKTKEKHLLKSFPKTKVENIPFYREYFQKLKRLQYPYCEEEKLFLKVKSFHESEDRYDIVCSYPQSQSLQHKILQQEGRIFSLPQTIDILKHLIIPLVISLGKKDFIYHLSPENIYFDGDNIKFSEPTIPQPSKILLKNAVKEDFACYPNEPIECWKNTEFDKEKYQVWKFATLFYRLLNNKQPFKGIRDYSRLLEKATNFSYCKSLENNYKTNYETCSIQIEDFFRRAFEPNPAKRMNFTELRRHPLFIDHFPKIILDSDVPTSEVPLDQDPSKKQFRKTFQKAAFLLRFLDKLNKLPRSNEGMKLISFKYVIGLFAKLIIEKNIKVIEQMRDVENPQNPYMEEAPNFHPKKESVKVSYTHYEHLLSPYARNAVLHSQSKLFQYKNKCTQKVYHIGAENKQFSMVVLDHQKHEFAQEFKRIYRSCTALLYEEFLGIKNQQEVKFLAYITICHAYNHLHLDEEIEQILSFCFNQKVKGSNVDLLEIWIENVATKENLISLINFLMDRYF